MALSYFDDIPSEYTVVDSFISEKQGYTKLAFSFNVSFYIKPYLKCNSMISCCPANLGNANIDCVKKRLIALSFQGKVKNGAVYLSSQLEAETQAEYSSLQQRDIGSSIQESSRKLAVDIRHCIDPNR